MKRTRISAALAALALSTIAATAAAQVGVGVGVGAGANAGAGKSQGSMGAGAGVGVGLDAGANAGTSSAQGSAGVNTGAAGRAEVNRLTDDLRREQRNLRAGTRAQTQQTLQDSQVLSPSGAGISGSASSSTEGSVIRR